MDNCNLVEKQGAFIYSRVFDAPRHLVWQAWTESARLAHWWLQPGQVSSGEFEYRHILAPERLIIAAPFSDMVRSARRRFVGTTWPLQVLNTLTFTAHEGTTGLTLHSHPISALEEEIRAFESASEGLRQSVDGSWRRLAAYLDREMEIAWVGGMEQNQASKRIPLV